MCKCFSKFIHLTAIIFIANIIIPYIFITYFGHINMNFFYNIIGLLDFVPHTVQLDLHKRKYTAAFIFQEGAHHILGSLASKRPALIN